MIVAKHTPGPWQARFVYRVLRRVREFPGDLRLNSAPEKDWWDACLMAASPDLLAMCEELQWEGVDIRLDQVCPVCGHRPTTGHRPDCRLALVISRAKGVLA